MAEYLASEVNGLFQQYWDFTSDQERQFQGLSMLE